MGSSLASRLGDALRLRRGDLSKPVGCRVAGAIAAAFGAVLVNSLFGHGHPSSAFRCRGFWRGAGCVQTSFCKGFPAPPPTNQRGDEGEGGKHGGQDGKVLGEKADQNEQGDGLGTLGYPTEIVEAFFWHSQRIQASALGNYGKRQKARPRANEGEQQQGSSYAIRRGVGQDKGKWNGGVKEEIERNIKEGSPIGRTSQSCDRAIESIQNAVQRDEQQAEQKLAAHNSRNSPQSHGKADDCNSVRSGTPRQEPPRQGAQQPLLRWNDVTVEHAKITS